MCAWSSGLTQSSFQCTITGLSETESFCYCCKCLPSERRRCDSWSLPAVPPAWWRGSPDCSVHPPASSPTSPAHTHKPTVITLPQSHPVNNTVILLLIHLKTSCVNTMILFLVHCVFQWFGARHGRSLSTALGVYFADYLRLWNVSWIRLRMPVYECVRTESVEVTLNFSDVWRYFCDICDIFAHDWTVFDFGLLNFCVLRHYTSMTCTTCSKTIGFPQSRIGIVVLLDHRSISVALQVTQLWSSIPVPSFRLRESKLWPLTPLS